MVETIFSWDLKLIDCKQRPYPVWDQWCDGVIGASRNDGRTGEMKARNFKMEV